jgi:hypothetical protein
MKVFAKTNDQGPTGHNESNHSVLSMEYMCVHTWAMLLTKFCDIHLLTYARNGCHNG